MCFVLGEFLVYTGDKCNTFTKPTVLVIQPIVTNTSEGLESTDCGIEEVKALNDALSNDEDEEIFSGSEVYPDFADVAKGKFEDNPCLIFAILC